MSILNFASHFFYGIRCSLSGLLVFWRLDSASASIAGAVDPPLAEESRRGATTILQQRRLANSQTTKTKTDAIVCRRPKAWKRVLQCISMNLLCVLLLYVTGWLISAGLSFFAVSRYETLSRIASNLSVLPLFLLSRIVNCLWFADIANASLQYRGLQPAPPISFSRAAADFVMAILLETVFLAQSLLVVYVPIPLISQLLSYIHLSMLYALYSFEYLWMSRGCELSKRLNRIETRWPFYAGFGCVLTLATSVFAENFVLSGCIFGCLFPFFIISSYMVCIALLSALRNLGVDERTLMQDATGYPVLHIFWPSLLVTNKLSLWVSSMARVGHGQRMRH